MSDISGHWRSHLHPSPASSKQSESGVPRSEAPRPLSFALLSRHRISLCFCYAFVLLLDNRRARFQVAGLASLAPIHNRRHTFNHAAAVSICAAFPPYFCLTHFWCEIVRKPASPNEFGHAAPHCVSRLDRTAASWWGSGHLSSGRRDQPGRLRHGDWRS